MNRKRGKHLKKRNTSATVFFSLILISFIIVLLLEFINYKSGKESFVFTKLFKKEKKVSNLNKFNFNLLDFLNSEEISFDYFKDTSNRFHFKIDVEKSKFRSVLRKTKKLAKKYNFDLITIEVRRTKKKTTYLYKIVFSDTTTHLLLVNSIEQNLPANIKEAQHLTKYDRKNPKIAFIIDDIGAYSIGAYELKKLGIPITASVLPDSIHAAEEAKWLSEYKLNTLIHLPMQPKKDADNYPDPREIVTISSSLSEIKTLIRRVRKIVPNAYGINNHQGSLVTSNKDLMMNVLRIIKSEGMYFVDSKTDFDSIAFKTAKKMRVKTAVRDVFLDHIRTYDHSIFQIKRLVEIAKRTGKGIAIGHPFESTIAAIQDSLNYIKSNGIKIVIVNDLLE